MQFAGGHGGQRALSGPLFGLCVLALSTLAAPAQAEPKASEPAQTSCVATKPWSRLGSSAKNFARPVPLALTWFAVLTPLSLAPTGVDHQLRLVAQHDLFGKPRLEPVSVWTPYVLGGGVLVGYTVGLATGSCATQRVLAPLLQAGVLSYTLIGVTKFAVGRQWPNGGADPSAPDRLEHPERARDFAPFQRGIGAWPSGHTAIMFAGAAAFRASNPELGWLSFAGYPLAVGVAAGMWFGDHHWASDIVSGALLGEAIGSSVGKSFSETLGVPGALAVSSLSGGGFYATWLTAF
ncbi:MAG TPA: phosphatase PAP2 family protein [Polyangiaceae bacterium]|nr:phosphatase PAP2 family protein [Polyangiaceae bacterium]